MTSLSGEMNWLLRILNHAFSIQTEHEMLGERSQGFRQMKDKNAARGLPATETIDVKIFSDSIDVESGAARSEFLLEVHQPAIYPSR